MTSVTIPRKITNGKELVVIPRDEYEALMTLRKVYEFQPSASQKRILREARKKRFRGEVLSVRELKRNLGLTD